MGSLGTGRAQSNSIWNNPIFDRRNSSSFLGDVGKDKEFDDSIPCEETDEFDDDDTQVMDFNDETQPVDFDEETQIMDLACETQVRDDYEFIEEMDTQLLDVMDSEDECNNDGKGVETQIRIPLGQDGISDRCEKNTSNVENESPKLYGDERKARTETSPSNDTERSSGSMRRGFTAVRTAALRAGGLAARRSSSKDVDNGFCATELTDKSSKLDTVGVDHGSGKDNDKGLSNENKCGVARKLLIEDVAANGGCDDSICAGRADLHQLPSGDNGLGGLSYVDSQEPGQLSQENALEFVDKFLKINVFGSDLDKTPENAADVVGVSPITIGPQSLALQINRRATLAEVSAFDWDDNREDEGGGEFFIKKKNELLGTSSEPRKCRTKPQISRVDNRSDSKFVANLKNQEEQPYAHGRMDHFDSDSKLVNGRKTRQNGRRNVNNHTEQQLAFDSGDREVEAAAPNAELSDMLNVGIDTQMAAEAMEALSTGSALVTNNDRVAGQDRANGKGKCINGAAKNLPKKSSVRKRHCPSNSDICTRSKRSKQSTTRSGEEPKCSVALRTRSQCVVEVINNEVVKSKGNGRRLDMKDTCSEKERDSSGVVPAKIHDKKRESGLELELKVKRHNSRGKINLSTPFSPKTRLQMSMNRLNGEDEGPGDSRAQRDCFNMGQVGSDKRKRNTRGDVVSESLNAREEALNQNIVINIIKNDNSGHTGSAVQGSPNQVNGSAKRETLLEASVRHDAVFQSIARRTRSKSSARCSGIPRKGKGLLTGDLLSVENPCQSSPQKHKTCSSPANESALHVALEESPGEAKRSSDTANSTPAKLKIPESAVSPVCAGDEYSSPSCKRLLTREFHSLGSNEHKHSSPFKDFRQRRDTSSIRVLFSQHLDDDIKRQQKKVLSRLGVLEASSISNATHFVADFFVRTRNMLEAIANGKVVVTHLWLESCGQASCLIDERIYILRDAKKEKELGFSMPTSLARASRHPLLEGRRVLITSNIKPGKEIVSSLVKAVHGQAIERVCRSDRLPDDLLVLSCEEDFKECVSLLEKGIAVYSSELLLNGIITQHLEYERYRIFADHVKKTRSTVWVKKDGRQFLPVDKAK